MKTKISRRDLLKGFAGPAIAAGSLAGGGCLSPNDVRRGPKAGPLGEVERMDYLFGGEVPETISRKITRHSLINAAPNGAKLKETVHVNALVSIYCGEGEERTKDELQINRDVTFEAGYGKEAWLELAISFYPGTKTRGRIISYEIHPVEIVAEKL